MKKLDKEQVEAILEGMMKRTGEFVLRRDIGKFTGGLLHPKTIANLESEGKFPVPRVKFGKHVAYPTAAIIAYLLSIMSFG